ncbi:MAG: glutamine-hydrolyzing GMP synthase [Deferribacterota bacterium]|nr:glutamine-hydrolyzing GMP synthase [Deferribacterota bacterium]
MNIYSEKIIIIDYGSQYTKLIARRIREIGVFSEVVPYNKKIDSFSDIKDIKGIILSGGPYSIYEKNAPYIDERIFSLGVPILGICYGMQVVTHYFGGVITKGVKREYGKSSLLLIKDDILFRGIKKNSFIVWMSYGDLISKLPKGFSNLAKAKGAEYAAIKKDDKEIYALQFHPEVSHTKYGKKILYNFIVKICKCKRLWSPKNFIKENVEYIKERVGNNKILCALSGGVDSSVTAAILHRAIGDNLITIFVNTGLLRKNEHDIVVKTFRDTLGYRLIYVDASNEFISALKEITDPEMKRKIIGRKFIEIFESKAKGLSDVKFLAQGTLYPDVIESAGDSSSAVTIKSHHNVGGLPETMNLELVEPLRDLFKDEVRRVGLELGLSEELIYRHPFPGPGLAVRILGEVTEEKLSILREADYIFIEELKKNGLYRKIWQAFAVLLPIKTVGVMGDKRTYEYVLALRAVDSVDGMTASCHNISHYLLEDISNRIINEVNGINRVVFDISSKPPATIEWE